MIPLRMNQPTPRALAQYIDHTILKPDASARAVEQLCEEAREFGFFSVCVNGSRVAQARTLLNDSGVKVAAVVGFPLGATDSDTKRFETEAAVDNGAEEIDLVLNIGWLKEGEDAQVSRELRDVVEAADERTVKVILETCLLTREEKIRACQLVAESGAHFVKTSTGFGAGGATLEDVKLMREQVGPKFGVKASGGIRDTATALAMIKAGATRLGTSSGVAIIQGLASAGNASASASRSGLGPAPAQPVWAEPLTAEQIAELRKRLPERLASLSADQVDYLKRLLSALTAEQLMDLDVRLSIMRHDIRGHLGVIVAAVEMMRLRPDYMQTAFTVLNERSPKIIGEMDKFSEAFEHKLGLRR
jgi:deoxyribose-phosphate aldolase